MWYHSTPTMGLKLCTLASIMLTVGNKIYFMTSPSGTKSCSGTRTMSLKTTSQLLLTSNYSLNLRHQNHNLPPFFQKTFLCCRTARKSREYGFETMKNKKTKFWAWIQTSWNWSHNSCSLSGAPKAFRMSLLLWNETLVAAMLSFSDHRGQNAI